MLLFLIFTLTSCGFLFQHTIRDVIPPSSSPCTDGILSNIDGNGCVSLYFGVNGEVLKLRCTYSEVDNQWTRGSFYIVPKDYDGVKAGWRLFCTDDAVNSYISFPQKL